MEKLIEATNCIGDSVACVYVEENDGGMGWLDAWASLQESEFSSRKLKMLTIMERLLPRQSSILYQWIYDDRWESNNLSNNVHDRYHYTQEL